MQKTVLIAVFTGFLATANAQPFSKKKGTYMPGIMKSYTILNSEPEYKKTAVIFDPIVFNTAGLGGGAATAIRLESQFRDNIMPWAKVSYSWIDFAASDWKIEMPKAVEGIKNQLTTEAGIAYFFVNKICDVNVKVDVDAQGSMMHGTTYYYTKVPSKVRRMVGARAGNYTFRKALAINDDSRTNYSYKSTDGSYQVAINLPYDKYINPAPPISVKQPSGKRESPVTMTYTNSVFTGVHFRKVKNTRIALNGNRIRTSERVTDIYADIFLPYSSSISNIVDSKGTEWQLAPKVGTKNSAGWRIGGAMRYPKGHFWQNNLEIGKRPGPKLHSGFKGNGMYIALGVGFSIGFGKYNVAYKKNKSESTSTENGEK